MFTLIPGNLRYHQLSGHHCHLAPRQYHAATFPCSTITVTPPTNMRLMVCFITFMCLPHAVRRTALLLLYNSQVHHYPGLRTIFSTSSVMGGALG